MSVIVRAATPDTAQLPRVVGGRAAAPDEWEAWAEEPGHALVAHDGGRIVGGIHVSLVGRTEAWVENLRVHPDAWRQGIALQLVREAEGVARHYGAAVVRTAVPAHEYAAQAVAERRGYRQVLRCAVVQAPLPPGPAHIPYDAPVEVPSPDRAGDLVRFLESTGTLAGWRGLIPLGWRFRRIVPELVRGLIRDRRAIVAVDPAAGTTTVQAAALFAVRGAAVILSALDGSAPGVQAAFWGVMEEAKARGAGLAVVFTPQVRSLEPLALHGWTPHPWCPDGMLVFEKGLAS